MTAAQNMLTGQYMIGYVAVGIYLLESTGAVENWYPAAEDTTFNEIVEGLDWLAHEAFERGHKLVWVYPPAEKVSTSFEPISGDIMPKYELLNWVFDWLDDVYTSHGQSDEWDGAYGLANNLRQQYKTNWSVEIAVVMDDNDPDHMFADGKFAHHMPYYEYSFPCCVSSQRSPVVVMTYNNASWGPWRMDAVTAHEVSHVFGASDEYNDPGYEPHTCDDDGDCGVQQSYLQTDNGNCEICNENSVRCYMRADTGSICSYTPPELGWRDSDGDGASDAIDQNYAKYLWTSGVYQGDILRIYNSLTQLVNVFCVTSDQICGPDRSFFWNGVQLNNDPSVVGNYVITRNGEPHQTRQLWYASPQTWPITEHHFSRDTLYYKCPGMTLYLRNTLYDSLGNLFSRPRYDGLTYVNTLVDDDLSGYPDGLYRSEVSGWLPNGHQAEMSVLQFVNYLCGDATNDGVVNVGDVNFLIALLFQGGPVPVHPSSADVNGCTGNVNIADLNYLVSYLFHSGPAPVCCHSI